MNILKRDCFILLFLGLLIGFSLKAYVTPDLFESHDAGTHTARLANYYLALQEGQFPPALAPTLQGKLGYPIFIFIYPLPYLLGSFFHFLGFSYAVSLKLVLATGHFFSGIFFYLFLKSETQKTLPSVIGTILFIFAPYRFVLLFVRGALAEGFSYLFIASSLYCLSRLFTLTSLRWIGLTALSIAGLLLSHQLTSIMFLPVLAIYSITKLLTHQQKAKAIISITISLILSACIAAFIYVPTFFERQYLQFDQLLDYTQDHFVTINQLLSSSWGYGFSEPGTYRDNMSYQVGYAQLAVIVLSTIYLITSIKNNYKKFIKTPKLQSLAIWTIAFVITFLLMIDNFINYAIWSLIPGLTYIDFPWRLLGIAVTTSSIATALLISQRRVVILAVFLGSLSLITNLGHLHIQGSVVLDDLFFENYYGSATSRNEFLTIWRATDSYGGIYGDYQAVEEQVKVIQSVSKTHHIQLSTNSDQSSTIVLNRFYFPGWQVRVDDQLLPFPSASFNLTKHTNLEQGLDYSGLMQIKIPPGKHSIKAFFAPSVPRLVGLISSTIGLIFCTLLIIAPSSLVSHFIRSNTFRKTFRSYPFKKVTALIHPPRNDYPSAH